MKRVIMFMYVLVGFSTAWAQTKASDKEWAAVIDGAKKEGKVVVAGSPDPVMRNDVIPKFTARFGIPVEFVAGRSSQIVSRVQTERASGIYSIDVYLAGPDTSANELYNDKLIDPLKPLIVMPEVADGSKWKTGKVWFADPQEQFIVRAFSSVATWLFINTDHVKPEEVRHVKDLLNPKWRGKISTEDPTTTGAGANMAARLYYQVGEEYVKNLYLDQKTVRTRERRQMTDWLARGTQPICLNCREDDVRPLVKDGFKVLEIFEINGVPSTINGSPWMLSLANKAPHPKAAQVFANWILSKEGLETYARGYGSATLRTDIDESFLNPGNVPKKGVKYFDDTEWKWIVTGRHDYREKVWQLLKVR
ncbi:MAG TPA: extracellular solute-binding protein [Candidatus Binatia bacterium]|jgi:iron(III) transport system substrate-binding protein|nr:extracellular solute-binding protein [Candidatus Binatia bacterium]